MNEDSACCWFGLNFLFYTKAIREKKIIYCFIFSQSRQKILCNDLLLNKKKIFKMLVILQSFDNFIIVSNQKRNNRKQYYKCFMLIYKK